jgi:hypothetical protein
VRGWDKRAEVNTGTLVVGDVTLRQTREIPTELLQVYTKLYEILVAKDWDWKPEDWRQRGEKDGHVPGMRGRQIRSHRRRDNVMKPRSLEPYTLTTTR